MSKISATVVADSKSLQSNRLTTLQVTFPRIILAELNTHRALSKNSASSRAIPFSKMVKSITENPFIPIAFQKEHSGMQGTEYITDPLQLTNALLSWQNAKCKSIDYAKELTFTGVTKQLCNRLLEPFMYHTVLISGTDEGWENFFNLRCPQYKIIPIDNSTSGIPTYYKSKKDAIAEYSYLDINHQEFWLNTNKGQAEIHMMALAEAIWDARNESTPKQLQAGEWHIPYEDKIYVGDTTSNKSILEKLSMKVNRTSMAYSEDMELLAIKISIAMAARVSYTVIGDEKEVSYETLLGIYDRIISANPVHASPTEHCSQCMTEDEYKSNTITEGDKTIYGVSRNFRGFKQYRQILGI